KALASKFSDNACHVDTTVHNPSRICKLYGTMIRKGESTTERPHRLSRILEVPAELTPASAEQLEALVDLQSVPGTQKARMSVSEAQRAQWAAQTLTGPSSPDAEIEISMDADAGSTAEVVCN